MMAITICCLTLFTVPCMCSACKYVYLLLLSTFTETCYLVANVVGLVCMLLLNVLHNYIIAVQANWTLCVYKCTYKLAMVII